MRFKFFLCASADLGVRRTNVSSSFCNAEYIGVSENAQAAIAAIRVPGAAKPPWSQLEEKLHCKLYKPRVANLRNLPKLRPVRNIAVRIEELCMVEDVEELSTEINVVLSVNGIGLRDGKSVVVNCGPQQIVRFAASKVPHRVGSKHSK